MCLKYVWHVDIMFALSHRHPTSNEIQLAPPLLKLAGNLISVSFFFFFKRIIPLVVDFYQNPICFCDPTVSGGAHELNLPRSLIFFGLPPLS